MARKGRVDAQLSSEIDQILAIDNHAHPVRPVAADEAPDTDYDALPVENPRSLHQIPCDRTAP